MTLFKEAVDFQNNGLQNVDNINNISGGDVRIENGISCAFVNAKSSIRCNDVIRIDIDGNICGNKLKTKTIESESVKCSEIDTEGIRCIETISARVIECDRLNTSGTTRIDQAGNLTCLTGKFVKFVEADEFRSTRIECQDTITSDSINCHEFRTSGVTRIDSDGVIKGSQLILLGRGSDANVPICVSAAANGFLAVTPLGTASAVPLVLTSNQTDCRGFLYEASDSVNSEDAFKVFTTDDKWVCNIVDGYGFFGNYDGKTSTSVNGKQVGGEWVQLTIPNPKGIISYYLKHHEGTIEQRPKSWTLAGSIDGESFFTIHAHTVDKLSDPEVEFSIPLSSVAIRHFRIIVTSIFPFNGSHLHGSLTIDRIGFEVGFGKDHARVPKHMLDISGTICAEALAFENGNAIKIDAGFYEGPSLSQIKFKAHFRSTPSIVVSVLNTDQKVLDNTHNYVEIISQNNTGFSARQWKSDLKTTSPVSLCINWTAIGA